MDTKVQLRLWEQGTWPEDDFTVADNLPDMELLASRHAAGDAFAMLPAHVPRL